MPDTKNILLRQCFMYRETIVLLANLLSTTTTIRRILHLLIVQDFLRDKKRLNK